MVLPRWTKGTVARVSLPASLALAASLGAVSAQAAAPGPDLRILSPRPDGTLGANSFNIDVTYRSRSQAGVVAAEIWVDGVRWHRRNIKTQQSGRLSIALDASTLTEGTHKVTVTVFTADGASSTRSIDIQVGGSQSAQPDAFGGPEVTFRNPAVGAKVSGTVELNVEAQDRTGANPYVTFFVDKEFKTLKNYPPYTFNWDTTTVPNGPHTIEAMAYVESSKTTTTRRVQVVVDNPGGNTVRQTDIPDLSLAASPKTPRSAAPPISIPLPKPVGASSVVPKSGRISRPTLNRPAPPRFASPRKSAPRASAPTSSPIPTALGARWITSAVEAALDVRLAVPGGGSGSGGSIAAPTAPRTARVSRTVVPPVLKTTSPVVKTTPTVKPVATAAAARTNLAARQQQRPTPKVTASLPTPGAAAARRVTSATASTKVSRATPRPAVRPARRFPSMAGLPDGALQIAFNGQQVAFDVQPRVEAGMPLAPFRQLFEHSGGKVTWVPETRVVRAVNAEREVVINVGKSNARINNQNVSLERPAFIESGRTIVPISFVGKALNVDIQYDPATGRLQITSKK